MMNLSRPRCNDLIPVALLLLLLAPSCKRHSGKEFHPSPMADKLYSGQSLESVERRLNMMDGSFDIVVDRKPLPDDTRPPYRVLVISRKNAQVAGQPGQLELTFFNDQLMTMQFYPANLAAARAAVDADEHISLASGEAHIDPSTRVWVGKDEQERSYIGWIDKFLQAEQDAWVAKYDNPNGTQSAQ